MKFKTVLLALALVIVCTGIAYTTHCCYECLAPFVTQPGKSIIKAVSCGGGTCVIVDSQMGDIEACIPPGPPTCYPPCGFACNPSTREVPIHLRRCMAGQCVETFNTTIGVPKAEFCSSPNVGPCLGQEPPATCQHAP